MVTNTVTSHLSINSNFVREQLENSYFQLSNCSLYSSSDIRLSNTDCGAICNLETNCFYYKFAGDNCQVCITGVPDSLVLQDHTMITLQDTVMLKSGWQFWLCFGLNGTASSVQLQSHPPDFSIKSQLNFDFKTNALDGIIVFSSAVSLNDIYSVYIRNGHVHFTFNTGFNHISVTATTSTKYNDGKWHSVQVNKHGSYGQLKIDDETADMTAFVSSSTFTQLGEINFGKVPDSLVKKAENNFVSIF